MPKSLSSNHQDQTEVLEALGDSESFLEFQEMLSRVAKVERSILLLGERGTGKELAAQRLHYLSQRWDGPLVTLNCGAITASLVETELFGYEVGAFTGASKRRQGRFERADGGTLFLDELGNLPLEVQAKILRVIEYGVFERVGGTEAVAVDVRIVGATHVDLLAAAQAGKFMPDLLDRLSFEVLRLPALRDRGGDVELLAYRFAAKMAIELGWGDVPEFTPGAMAQLEAYDWPGNIRELKNVVERAVYRSEGGLIEDVVLNPFAVGAKVPQPEVLGGGLSVEKSKAVEAELAGSLPEKIRKTEISSLKDALKNAQYNQQKAAKLMGLTYHQFRGLYRKHKKELDTAR